MNENRLPAVDPEILADARRAAKDAPAWTQSTLDDFARLFARRK